jgi:signal transduction histidine kinase
VSINLLDAADPGSLPAVRALPGSGPAGTAVVIGIGLACFVAQWVAVMLWVPPAQVSTVWVPGGLLLAIALLTEPGRWPVVLTTGAAATSLLFVVVRLVPLPGAVLLGLLAALQTAALAAVVRVVLRPIALATLREFLTYLIVVVLGGAGVASILFLVGVWGMSIRPPTFLVWRTFAIAAVLGYLLVTPTVVLLVRDARSIATWSTRLRLEAGFLVLLLALASGLVFTGRASQTPTWTACAMTLPPLLLWAAVRFGALGASASLLLVSVVSTLSANRGLGPFTNQSPGDSTLSLQLFILGTALPLLGLAVVLKEHEHLMAALRSTQVRLTGFARELIAAREEEATRIASELHDDVGQRMALVQIGLSRLRQTCAEAGPERVPDILHLQEQASAIARSLREISHQLHPAVLEHVGLTSALQLKCDEVSQATELDIRFVNHGDTSTIPRDVALCLYRVAQEAISNVVRHSGAHRVDLSLGREGSELLLEVTDDGRGFAPSAPDGATGLGLHSAAERLGSVGGTLAVDSTPGAGTILRAAVPLGKGDHASTAAHPRG